jgi:hypothetical protein
MKKYVNLAIGMTLLLGVVSIGTVQAQEIPEQNQKIIKYVDGVKNQKIDRGECWDLLNFALNKTGATWNSPDEFGTVVKPKKEKLYPGDMISFSKVRLDNPDKSWQTFYHHYAIVYEVKEDGVIVIAHQNYNDVRKVMFTDINISNVTKGTLTFFRPQAATEE